VVVRGMSPFLQPSLRGSSLVHPVFCFGRKIHKRRGCERSESEPSRSPSLTVTHWLRVSNATVLLAGRGPESFM
jgi:hypothetical protein